jgi:hypothetical protein
MELEFIRALPAISHVGEDSEWGRTRESEWLLLLLLL